MPLNFLYQIIIPQAQKGTFKVYYFNIHTCLVTFINCGKSGQGAIQIIRHTVQGGGGGSQVSLFVLKFTTNVLKKQCFNLCFLLDENVTSHMGWGGGCRASVTK